jgi:hypothetical protein
VLRFANHPFLLLEAAVIDGWIKTFDKPPDRLPAFRLLGRASPVDHRALEWVLEHIEADQLAGLAQLALDWKQIGFTRSLSIEKLFSALLSCLPVELRKDYSFSTDLKFSTQRQYKWISVPNDEHQFRHVERLSSLKIVDPVTDLFERIVRRGDYYPILEALLRERDFVGLEDLVDPKHLALRRRTGPLNSGSGLSQRGPVTTGNSHRT